MESARLTPAATTSISTSPVPGAGSGTSVQDNTSGPPGRSIVIACTAPSSPFPPRPPPGAVPPLIPLTLSGTPPPAVPPPVIGGSLHDGVVAVTVRVVSAGLV